MSTKFIVLIGLLALASYTNQLTCDNTMLKALGVDSGLTDSIEGKDMPACKFLQGQQVCCSNDDLGKFAEKFEGQVKEQTSEAESDDKESSEGYKELLNADGDKKAYENLMNDLQAAASTGDDNDKAIQACYEFQADSETTFGKMGKVISQINPRKPEKSKKGIALLQKLFEEAADKLKKLAENASIKDQGAKDALKKVAGIFTELSKYQITDKASFLKLGKDFKEKMSSIGNEFKVFGTYMVNVIKEASKDGLPPRVAFASVFKTTIANLVKMNPLGIIKEMDGSLKTVMEARKQCMVWLLKMRARVMCLACKADKSEFTQSNAMKLADSTCTALTGECLPFVTAVANSKKFAKGNIKNAIDGAKVFIEALKSVVAELKAYKDAPKDKKQDALKKLGELKKQVVQKIGKNVIIKKLLAGKPVGKNSEKGVKKAVGCEPGAETCKPLCQKVFNRAKGGIDVKLIRQFVKESKTVEDDSSSRILEERILTGTGAQLESDKYKTDMETKADAFPEATSSYVIFGARLSSVVLMVVGIIALIAAN